MKIVSSYPGWVTFMGMSDYNDHVRGKLNVTPPLVVVVLQEFGHFGINGALAWAMVMNLTANLTRNVSNPGRFKGADGKIAEYDDARIGMRALAQWVAIHTGHAEIKRLKPEQFVVAAHYLQARGPRAVVVEVEDLVFEGDPGFGLDVAATYADMLSWIQVKKGGTPAHDPLPPKPDPLPEPKPVPAPPKHEPTPPKHEPTPPKHEPLPLPPEPDPMPQPPTKKPSRGIFDGIKGALMKRVVILILGWAVGAASAALPSWAGPILEAIKKLILGAIG